MSDKPKLVIGRVVSMEKGRPTIAVPVNPAGIERLARVRQYVQNNLDLWDTDPDDPIAVAYADIFRKVLNVIDTGNPI